MLEEGVSALEEDRFTFKPPADIFSTKLAKLYVKRGQWLKPVLTTLMFIVVFLLTYYMMSIRPQRIERESLPFTLKNNYSKIIALSHEAKATRTANELHDMAKIALESDDIQAVKEKISALHFLLERLRETYTIQIVQENGKHSGIWRVPPHNPYGKNYYLLVEARNDLGEKVSVTVNNEENNEKIKEDQWGLRVNEQTFNHVAQDKADDGIIQNRVIGVKKVGYLSPEYSIETTGATITKW